MESVLFPMDWLDMDQIVPKTVIPSFHILANSDTTVVMESSVAGITRNDCDFNQGQPELLY